MDLGSDVTICVGDTANLFATGATTYLWSDASTEMSLTIFLQLSITQLEEVTFQSRIM